MPALQGDAAVRFAEIVDQVDLEEGREQLAANRQQDRPAVVEARNPTPL
jgi:hypothetical protein